MLQFDWLIHSGLILARSRCLKIRAEKGRAVKFGPMCDAEKDWHERSFRASGEINGCQKSPLDKPEMTFSFFIFKPPVTSF